MKILKSVLKWIGNILLVLFLIIGLLSIYSKVKVSKNPGEIPAVFGFRNFTVLTGSMRPYIQPGDMIICRKVNTNLINKDDVITFRQDGDMIVTHRVVEKKENSGKCEFKTKGDANNTEDETYINESQLLGKFIIKLPYVGYVLYFMRSRLGFITIFGCIIVFVLISEIKNILAKNKKVITNDKVELKN